MNHTPRSSRNRSVVGLMVLSTAFLVGPATLADSGACYSAEIPETFQLPDGTSHASGRLTLCGMRALTPSTTLHKTYVEGQAIGMLPSHRGRAEAEQDEAAMIFSRGTDGRLALLGYTDGEDASFFLGGQASVTATVVVDQPAVDESVILIAANLN